MTLLALQAPAARDLRTVVATLNLIDDPAPHGGPRRARRPHRPHRPTPPLPLRITRPPRTVVTDMAEVAGSVATAATALLIDHNPDQATMLVAQDATIDALRDQLTTRILQPDRNAGIAAAIDLTQLGR